MQIHGVLVWHIPQGANTSESELQRTLTSSNRKWNKVMDREKQHVVSRGNGTAPPSPTSTSKTLKKKVRSVLPTQPTQSAVLLNFEAKKRPTMKGDVFWLWVKCHKHESSFIFNFLPLQPLAPLNTRRDWSEWRHSPRGETVRWRPREKAPQVYWEHRGAHNCRCESIQYRCSHCVCNVYFQLVFCVHVGPEGSSHQKGTEWVWLEGIRDLGY